jgi:glycosyltransferase involved in cell wall biosynthesis
MRILMISPNPLDLKLGASKVTIELAAALNDLSGVHCELIGPDTVGATRPFDRQGWTTFSRAQRDYLRTHAAQFDVVDYDHEHLPFDRSEFDARPLFVARSVLLVHYLERITFPVPLTARTIVSRLLHGARRARFQRARIADATRTVHQADLVNVSNDDDRRELVRRGVAASKIAVIPFGMSAARRREFDAVPEEPPNAPVVAFVGSFDFRKGAADFPDIFARIRSAAPDTRLALFGTTGHFRDAAAVRAIFPRHLRPHVSIHPRFEPGDLPTLLSACSVGVFPSYCEGFGFGVLEMLAAAIPVVAYDAPGPPSMLGPDRLVPPGDTRAMADKVVALLRNREALARARRDARLASAPFDWNAIARRTVDVYASRLSAGRAGVPMQVAG